MLDILTAEERRPLPNVKAISLACAIAAWLARAAMLARILLSAIIAAAAPLVVEAQEAAPVRADDGYFQQMTRLAEGVWVLAQPGFLVQPAGNVTVVEQSDGVVLIDAGGSPGAARRIVDAVRSLTAKPVKAVVITHWHGDHPQGLSEILRSWPAARTISTRATQAHLRNPMTMNTPSSLDPLADEAFQKRVQGFVAYCEGMAAKTTDPRERSGWIGCGGLFRQYARDMAGAVTLAPVEAFAEALTLPDPLRPVELRYLGRANTDGDAVAWLPRQRVLVTGDIVVSPIPFGFGSYPEEWLRVLRQIEAYDFAVLVPGHGQPQRDRAYVARLVTTLADVRRQVGRLAGQGHGLDDIRRRLDVSTQTALFAGDDPWLRRWFDEYWVKPITASAYKEAVGHPIVQSLSGG